MGGAFAKGYAQALMDYILEHPTHKMPQCQTPFFEVFGQE